MTAQVSLVLVPSSPHTPGLVLQVSVLPPHPRSRGPTVATPALLSIGDPCPPNRTQPSHQSYSLLSSGKITLAVERINISKDS